MYRSLSAPAITAPGPVARTWDWGMPPAVSRARLELGLAVFKILRPGEVQRAASMVSDAVFLSELVASMTRWSLAWIPAASMAAQLAREAAGLPIKIVLGPVPAASMSKTRQDLE